ncbi:MAG: HK97 family phage prohead protease [Peptostreptococcaceae bacterium]|nr:HK97 family phage prohead protease [Peptostreptococcaceae bacterium]
MEIRMSDNTITVEGYVNSVARDSKPMHSPKGEFVEQVLPKVWTRALRKAEDVKILFNHIESRELGSISKGNLELYEDAIGLRVKCTIDDEEVVKKAKNNELRGWSFGFLTNKDKWEEINDNLQRRYLQDIDLLEVSLLTVEPAYAGCLAEIRSEGSTEEIRFNQDIGQVINKNNKDNFEELKSFSEIIKEIIK